MFCDADDFYQNNGVFEFLYKRAKTEACDLIQFGMWKKYNHLRRSFVSLESAVQVSGRQFIHCEYPKLLCSFWTESHLTTNTCNKFYHCSVKRSLPASNIAERLFMGDDEVLNLYLLENCGAAVFIPEKLYVYRQGSGGTSRFSLTTMQDLNAIKRYQLQFLERWNGDRKDEVYRVLFSEVAGWFFVYMQQAINHLNAQELRELVETTLKLPAFVLAQEYYTTHTDEKWEAIELLRNADTDEIIEHARKAHTKISWKTAGKNVLKKIFYNL